MAVAQYVPEELALGRSRWPGRAQAVTSGWLRRHVRGRVALFALGLVTLIALVGPTVAPHDPTGIVADQLASPSWSHPMGTDEIGRDVFSRVLAGWQASWFGAMVVVLSGVVIGTLIGLLAGRLGGIVDSILMRVTDIILALPGMILVIVVVAALGYSYRNTLIGLTLIWWPLYARLVRVEVRKFMGAPHIEAARLADVGFVRLVRRHLLPGTVPVLVVAASFDLAGVVLTLAGLSFLGLGAPAPAPELGAMTARGMSYIYDSWWIPMMPALAVFVMALVASFAGDALRDRIGDR